MDGAQVRELLRPGAFPHPVGETRLIETHISWVLLTGDYAYKIKKPVEMGFLDFSSLESRRHFCREELRLNRRLADWVYLDVVPLTEESGGRLRIGGAGRVVDWLVKMRRLPEDRMLDRLIRRGRVTDEQLARVARRLAAFYGGLPAEPLGAEPYVSRVLAQNEEQRRHLQRHDIEALTADQVAFIMNSAMQLGFHPIKTGLAMPT